LRWRADPARRTLVLVALAALVALSLYERSRALDASYWIDEGISVGIAQHSFSDIPGVLAKDGSPPLYYLLLHVWIQAFGAGEAATHWLSLVLALLTIPAAYWAASVWGRGAGLAAAVLAAFTPFLDDHATETRMYALLALLAVLACGAFVRGFVLRRRRFVALFAPLLAAMLWTHNWALFFALGTGVAIAALAWSRRDEKVLYDGLYAGGAALALYAAWIPTLVVQMRDTGAPWSTNPSLGSLDELPHALLGKDLVIVLVAVALVAGVVAVVRRGVVPEREALLALGLLLVTSVVAAFVSAQVEPGWASRYFAVFLAPLIVLVALAAARARWVGAAALVAVALISFDPDTPNRYFKANAEPVAEELKPSLRYRDIVLSTQAEQVPLLRHYMGGDLTYWDPMRRVEDPQVMDWEDATARLRAARPPESIEPLLGDVDPGQRLVLVRPIVRGSGGWRAPWTRLVRIRSDEIERALARDRRFRAIGTYRGTAVPSSRVGVTATLYERVAL
jgi:uncharacterized membrane protein